MDKYSQFIPKPEIREFLSIYWLYFYEDTLI